LVGDRYSRGIENTAGDCGRNSTFQILMSTLALIIWLEKYHSTGCPTDHCTGCHLRKICELIYPLDPKEEIRVDTARQKEVIQEVDNFFADIDGYFKKNGFLIGQAENWPKTLREDGEHAGGHTEELLHFLCSAI
jgi:hypothetical protein